MISTTTHPGAFSRSLAMGRNTPGPANRAQAFHTHTGGFPSPPSDPPSYRYPSQLEVNKDLKSLMSNSLAWLVWSIKDSHKLTLLPPPSNPGRLCDYRSLRQRSLPGPDLQDTGGFYLLSLGILALKSPEPPRKKSNDPWRNHVERPGEHTEMGSTKPSLPGSPAKVPSM